MMVKIFSGSPRDVEKECNDWLSKRKSGYTFLDRLQTEVAVPVSGTTNSHMTLTIFYEIKT